MHMTTGIMYIYYIHVGYYRDYRDKSLNYRDITFSIITQLALARSASRL